MSVFEKLTDVKNSFEGKLLAVFVAMVLILSCVQVTAFATSNLDAQEATSSEQLLKGETSADIVPELGEALVTFDLTQAYVTIKDQLLAATEVKVEENEPLNFKAFALEGYELATVTAKDAVTGAPIELKKNAGTYTIAAADVASSLVVSVISTKVEASSENPTDATAGDSANDKNADPVVDPAVDPASDPTADPIVDPMIDTESEGVIDNVDSAIKDTEEIKPEAAADNKPEQPTEPQEEETSFLDGVLAFFGFGPNEETTETKSIPEFCTVTFVLEGTEVAQEQVRYGALATTPTVDSVGQNVFGWYYVGTETLFNQWDPITEDITLEAALGDKHMVRYLDYDESEFALIAVESGTSASDLDPQEPNAPVGKRFSVWVDQETGEPLTGLITKDVTLIPQYSDFAIAVFVTDGPIIESQVISSDNNNKIVKPADDKMIRSGYSFSHWTTDSSRAADSPAFDFGKAVTETTYLYAVWKAEQAGYVLNYWAEKADRGLADPAIDDPATPGNEADGQYDLVWTRTINADNASLAGTTGKKLNDGDSEVITKALIDDRSYASSGQLPIIDLLDYCDFYWTDAGYDGKELNGSGTTVINVYTKRAVYDFNFNLASGKGSPMKITINNTLDALTDSNDGRVSFTGQAAEAEDEMPTITNGTYTVRAKLGEKVGTWWPYKCEPTSMNSTFINWSGYHGLARDDGDPTINKGYIRVLAEDKSSEDVYLGSGRITDSSKNLITSGTLAPTFGATPKYHETRFYFTELTSSEAANTALTDTAVSSIDKENFLDDPKGSNKDERIVKHNDKYYRFSASSEPGNYQVSWNPRGWPGASIEGFHTIDTKGTYSSARYMSVLNIGPKLNNGYYGSAIQGNICYFMPRVVSPLTLYVGEGATISNAALEEHKYSYNDQNAYSKMLAYEDEIKLPGDPVRSDGWTFEGWYIDEKFETKFDPATMSSMPANSYTLYAKFVGPRITVNYHSDFTTDGNSLVASTNDYGNGDTLASSDLDGTVLEGVKRGDVVPGYGVFQGWYFKTSSDSPIYTSASWGMPLAPTGTSEQAVYDLFASFSPQDYSVTFMVPDDASDIGNVADYSEVNESPIGVSSGAKNTLAKKGYHESAINGLAPTYANNEFVGWYTVDGNQEYDARFLTSTTVTENVTVYAKYRTFYDVAYEYDGVLIPEGAAAQLPSRTTCTVGETVTVADQPAVEGYRFVGWDVKSSNAVVTNNEFEMPDSDVVFVGIWEEDHSITKDVWYTVEYYLNDETEPRAAIVMTEAVWIHADDVITVDANTIDTTNFFGEGYSFVRTDPSPLPATAAQDDKIRVYYVSDGSEDVLVSYIVRYLDQATNEPVAEAKLVTGAVMGSLVTEDALDIEGYTLVGENQQDLALVSGGLEIVFYYESNNPPVVPPVDPGTDTPGATDGGTTLVPVITQVDGGPVDSIVLPIAAVLEDAAETALDALGVPTGQPIDDDATPLANRIGCWMHYYIAMGLMITAIYAVAVLLHRRRYMATLDSYEEEALQGAFQETEATSTSQVVTPAGSSSRN